MSEQNNEQEKRDLRVHIWERTTTLVTAAFSLVAALAWNDAIQSLFKEIFGQAASLYAKFFYAIVVTIISVIFITRLAILSNKVNGKLHRNKKE